jgi:transcriptional regulator with XRE-family HTH domain
MKNIGKSLRRVRDRLGETQVQFARRFGVDQPTYCRWEHDERRPSRATVMLMERVIQELADAKGIEAGG